jgi:hypothetical protein
MMIETYMTCDHDDECDNEVTAVHAEDFPLADARVAVATCAAAVGWQVGTPYDRDDTFDLCPEHRLA